MFPKDVGDSRQPSAWRSPRAWLVLVLVCAAGLGLDLTLKTWSFADVATKPVVLDQAEIQKILDNPRYNPIPPHRGVSLLPGNLLDMRLVINRGAVFGIGQNQRIFFVAFTLAALAAAIAVFARWTSRRAVLAHVAIALILAGGLGNLYDRLRYTLVRDFLHMLPGWKLPFGWTWPGGTDEIFPWVFNAADVMLLVGMGLLMLHINSVERRRKLVRASAGGAGAEAAQPQS